MRTGALFVTVMKRKRFLSFALHKDRFNGAQVFLFNRYRILKRDLLYFKRES